MKQKKFKIKSTTLIKFKSTMYVNAKWLTDTEPTITSITTTSNTTGMFNK